MLKASAFFIHLFQNYFESSFQQDTKKITKYLMKKPDKKRID